MMFRLPVCPHCGTVYRYQDTKKAQKKRTNTCYHCKKQFKVKFLPYVAIEALVLIAVCIGINLLLLTRMEKLNVYVLFAVTVIFLLLIYLLIPFFLKFERIEENFKEKRGNQPKYHKNFQNSSKNRKK